MVSIIERQSLIVRETEAKGKVDVDSLADRFGVSAVTIRSDLNSLGRKGLIVRSRGGAVADSRLARELSVEEKYGENQSTKRSLGLAVVELIGNETRSLLLDSGTTTEEVARGLVGFDGLQVMTNGLNVAAALARNTDIQVSVTGGQLRPKSMSFYGPAAEKSLDFLHFDKFVLGVDGFDLNVGLTTYFEQEAVLNRLMCDVSSEVIAVMDSSKFGRRSSHIIRRHTDIDCLVTDSNIPDQARTNLEQAGVKLVVVDC